jgi:hypothetical protein
MKRFTVSRIRFGNWNFYCYKVNYGGKKVSCVTLVGNFRVRQKDFGGSHRYSEFFSRKFANSIVEFCNSEKLVPDSNNFLPITISF